ncbi:MAG TPA: hypothetical protein VFR49_13320 [Solirubrobacteraceae bacterium]|nr:hypothetical protein [Solirubrobacteraceae bacterium]
MAVALLVVLAAFFAIDPGKHDDAAVALGALVIAIVVAVVDMEKLFANLSEFQLGPVGAKFGAEAGKAKAEENQESADETDSAPGSPAETMLKLRLRLEAKLAYLAKHQLAANGPATFLTIGSLLVDGGLTDEQAEVATCVLTFRDDEVARITEVRREALIERASELVKNLRATVHQNLTEHGLDQMQGGWSVSPIKHKGASPPYFQVEAPDRRTFRVAATYALGPQSVNLAKARDRLAATADRAPHADARVIVVPDNSVVPVTDPNSDPRIVHLHELAGALGA